KGTKGEKGTGLGLLLCKEFVDKHNGSITVESKLNEGTKFIIELPVI
ncbi:MAG: HAMP domain-containing histidine kinase, partial [Ignavibacteria bacterium]|nr:HAMP domain-containing histidine kinase [Ignavibacteria bacterium]